MDQLPEFYLLTGFLGSGKTTLLLDLLNTAEFADTGVIVNEVGEIDVDGTLMMSTTSGLKLAQLPNGCVCCAIDGGELAQTVAALMDENQSRGRRPFKRIVFETSGLSKPGPILRKLLALPLPFRIKVVSTYDCVHGALTSGQYEEAAAQLGAAQTIVLTKTDIADEKQVWEAVNEVRDLNPLANITTRDDADAAFTMGAHDVRHFDSVIESDIDVRIRRRAGVYFVEPDTDTDIEAVFEWIDNMAAFLGPRLLRAKGILDDGHGQNVLVQGVATIFDSPQLVQQRAAKSGLVVIARDTSIVELMQIDPCIKLNIRNTARPRVFHKALLS